MPKREKCQAVNKAIGTPIGIDNGDFFRHQSPQIAKNSPDSANLNQNEHNKIEYLRPAGTALTYPKYQPDRQASMSKEFLSSQQGLPGAADISRSNSPVLAHETPTLQSAKSKLNKELQSDQRQLLVSNTPQRTANSHDAVHTPALLPPCRTINPQDTLLNALDSPLLQDCPADSQQDPYRNNSTYVSDVYPEVRIGTLPSHSEPGSDPDSDASKNNTLDDQGQKDKRYGVPRGRWVSTVQRALNTTRMDFVLNMENTGERYESVPLNYPNESYMSQYRHLQELFEAEFEKIHRGARPTPILYCLEKWSGGFGDYVIREDDVHGQYLLERLHEETAEYKAMIERQRTYAYTGV